MASIANSLGPKGLLDSQHVDSDAYFGDDDKTFRQKLYNLRTSDQLVDVCLKVPESEKGFNAHRVILAASSDYFTTSMPLIITVKNVTEEDLDDILSYIYLGEVMVSRDRLRSFLEAAKILKIHNLQDISIDESDDMAEVSHIEIKQELPEFILTPRDDPLIPLTNIETETNQQVNLCLDEIHAAPLYPEECVSDLNASAIEIDIEGLELQPELDLDWSSNNNNLNSSPDRNVTASMDFDHIINNQPKVVLQRSPNWISAMAHETNFQNSRSRQHACKVCNKKFESLVKRRKHELSHNGDKRERPYACKYCNQKFLTSSSMNEHEIRHEGKKPNPSKTYHKKRGKSVKNRLKTSKADIQKQRLALKGDNRVRPHECKVCGVRFLTPSHLKDHETIHTGKPFSCSVCNRKFLRSNQLELHYENTHTRKLLSCSSCDQKFVSSNQLKLHKKDCHDLDTSTEHDKTRYSECDNCGQVFYQPFMLKKHLLNCSTTSKAKRCQPDAPFNMTFRQRPQTKQDSNTAHDEVVHIEPEDRIEERVVITFK